MNPALKRKVFFLVFILCCTIFWGIVKGSCNIALADLLVYSNRNILFLRLTRILLAIVVGSGLSVSGIALQAILRNPLAEPYLLGTSSGAGLGAVIAIIIGVGSVYFPLLAFIGALFSVILVYNISRQGNRIPVQSLILSGVIVSIALSGIVIFLISISSNETLHNTMWWLWGSLEVYDLKMLFIVSGIVVLGITAIFMFSQDLNAISIGEEEALHLGINTEAMKKTIFFITSLVTASIVCVSGIIGFVGLIVPHMIRFIVGPNHKILIPCSCIAGAIFMVVCDILSRTSLSPFEIPIVVSTAVSGAPICIILLKRRERIK